VTPDEPYDPSRCTACRGTGRVVSNLGGEPHVVSCPWCDGTGRFDPAHDAQASPAGEPEKPGR
jgi:DnaJ-class molecular chaperone